MLGLRSRQFTFDTSNTLPVIDRREAMIAAATARPLAAPITGVFAHSAPVQAGPSLLASRTSAPRKASLARIRVNALGGDGKSSGVSVPPPAFAVTMCLLRTARPPLTSFPPTRRAGPGEQPAPKKVLRREEEPEEYWKSEREREGKSAWSDPLAVIGILAIFFPFVVLGIAIGTGYVELNH
jgi:hypothetical protein